MQPSVELLTDTPSIQPSAKAVTPEPTESNIPTITSSSNPSASSVPTLFPTESPTYTP